MFYLGLSSLLNIEENAYVDVVRAVKIIRHPKYMKGSLYGNDIAIAELERPVEYSFGVSPVCLPDKTIPSIFSEDSTLIILGFGRIGHKLNSSDELLKAQVYGYSNSECEKYLKEKENITGVIENRKMCAISGENNRRETCPGDSGGPVIYKSNRDYLVGIISTGLDCGFQHPSINTKVSPYMKWMAKHIKKANFKGISN